MYHNYHKYHKPKMIANNLINNQKQDKYPAIFQIIDSPKLQKYDQSTLVDALSKFLII